MSILDSLRQRLQPVPEQRAPDAIPDPSDPVSKKLLSPGRPASESHFGTLGGNPLINSVYSQAKRSPINMIELFARYNPDVSQAIWNFLRMINPSHELEVKMISNPTKTDEEGLAILTRRANDLYGFYGRDYGGGLSVLMDVLAFSLLTQGAVAAELEINPQLNDVLDWCPVDPRYITIGKDPADGHLMYSVWSGGKQTPLLPEQFRYVPLDPSTLNPYGRSPLDPSLETVFFQTEVLRDIKAVAHAQGHPRFHITLVEEMVKKHIPARYLVPGQEENAQAWMNAYLNNLKAQYDSIEPDDALITYDTVQSSGLSAGQSTFNTESLIKIVEQQVISSVKQLPALLGRMDGSGLAHGTVQWQIFATTIESLRQPVAKIASWWATQTLRILGRQSVAEVEFPPIRVQDRVKEAQAEKMETETHVIWVTMGWESPDDAAMALTGHKAVELPKPLPEPKVEELAPKEGSDAGEIDMEEGMGDDAYEFMLGGGTKRAESFLYIDPWMKGRIKAVKDAVNAQMDVRRAKKYQEMEADKGAPERAVAPVNGKHRQ